MAMTLDGSNGVTFNDSSLQGAAASPYVLKNRIINGDMRIDQRNAGASVTPTIATYTIDRWKADLSVTSKYSVQQNAGSVTPPAGYTNYLGVTSLSSYSVSASDYFYIWQGIEGYNIADFAWGTANAKTITLSFWVRSSLTGTFGGSLQNSASNYSYPFSYTISSANTWEYKTITISGPTAGTWQTTTSAGIYVGFGLGVGSTYSGTAGSWASVNNVSATGATSVVGTNGATFYITGVQLEVGSTATPFERRQYGQELQLCQRYYEKSYNVGTVPLTNTSEGTYNLGGSTNSGGNILAPIKFAVCKRTIPTLTGITLAGSSGNWTYERSGATANATANSYWIGEAGASIYVTTGANWVVCNVYGHWTASAEL